MLLIMALIVLLIHFFKEPYFLAPIKWYNISPYRELSFFFAMLFGMFTYIFKLLIYEKKIFSEEKREGKLLMEIIKDHMDEITYPLVFSIVVFSGFLGQMEGKYITIESLLLSYYNGFFWQNILKKSE
jgi:hypothetical protein